MNKALLSIFTLILMPALMQASDVVLIDSAKFHLGEPDGSWVSDSYDDSSWSSIAVPEKWHGENTYAYYRVRFSTPGSFVQSAPYRGKVLLDLSYIDDCDETYLNGVLIGKTGVMPCDAEIDQSAWDVHRIYLADASLLRDENILAIKVYNRRTRGGVYGGPFTIRMPDLSDLSSFSFEENVSSDECKVTLSCDVPGFGWYSVRMMDPENGRILKRKAFFCRAGSGKQKIKKMKYDSGKAVEVVASFKDFRTGQSISATCVPKYILTPAAPSAPRFNMPGVYGVRPGHPLVYRLPVSGKRPMKFSSDNIPEGLSLNPESGAVLGTLDKAGEYKVTFRAVNECGEAEGSITFVAGNRIALTPQMGWNSWNCWGLSVTMEKVKQTANALIFTSLCDYGYNYINIDDAWQADSRTESGILNPNREFGDIAALAERLHSLGLKLGIYSSPGAKTCGGYLGSLGFEETDAATWNSWGIDYLKYDLCGYRRILDAIKNPTARDIEKPYLKMAEILEKQPRDILYSLCEYGLGNVWEWGGSIGANSWRTTGDITDTWESVTRIGFNHQRGLSAYSGPGHWNDPDMLVVGKVGWGGQLRNSRLTANEQYSHISLWALLAAPLLIGSDLSELDGFTRSLLCNNEVIAVDQDVLGQQAECVYESGDIQLWLRPLSDGSKAVGIFNMGGTHIRVNVENLLSESGVKDIRTIRDIWRQETVSTESLSEVFIFSHGVKLYRIK